MSGNKDAAKVVKSDAKNQVLNGLFQQRRICYRIGLFFGFRACFFILFLVCLA
jgi:hypothetical protein